MLLIDGDIIAYRVSCACEEEESVIFACHSADLFMEKLLSVYGAYRLYLTGEGNFRHDYAVTAPYKGNRTKPKPRYLQQVREHLISEWGAVVSVGEEADDAIAIAASMPFSDRDYPIIASIDKDFYQVAGTHYNFVKGEETYIDEDTAVKNLYSQIVTGDAIDNIIGVDGLGASGANDLLHGAINELDMWDIVRDQLGDERALENARLVFLRRRPGQIWEPPTQREDYEVWYA
jgi:hypothetical protein